MENVDPRTVEGFGHEWSHFDQSELNESELDALFAQYFSIFPWDELPQAAIGMDVGCGSGRWAQKVATRVEELHCIDASESALAVARRNLSGRANCRFHHASVEAMPLEDGSMDFGYSLGVLHHIPDTRAGLAACARKLKPGAPFLVYLYYAFDDKPAWFRTIWRLTDLARRVISRLPVRVKLVVTGLIAVLVYVPLARAAKLVEKAGLRVDAIPLAYYRDRSFYTMRTDALDRFGTRLEKRFRAEEVRELMVRSGLEGIQFSSGPPYWCAVGYRTGKPAR